MKFGQMQLRTSLSLMVLLLSVLTLAAVGVGWNALRMVRNDMAVLTDASLEAGREVRNAYQQSRYASAEEVALVCDNLNTHTRGAFYEAFPPEIARAYVKRIDFHYTPKHGSWLNVAECELSCLTSQCLAGRRIGELPLLQTEIAIWAEKTNAKQRAVDWQFKIDDARTKLKRLHPRIKGG